MPSLLVYHPRFIVREPSTSGNQPKSPPSATSSGPTPAHKSYASSATSTIKGGSSEEESDTASSAPSTATGGSGSTTQAGDRTPTKTTTALKPEGKLADPRDSFTSTNSGLTGLTEAQLYQLNQNILEESQSKKPLMSEITPLTTLRDEYEGAHGFVNKINWLIDRGWQGLRRTKGDGDCFYRSLAFSYVERILRSRDKALAVRTALSAIDSTYQILEAAGFQAMVYEDFADIFKTVIEQVITPDPKTGEPLDDQMLLVAFQTPEVSNSIVAFLRLLTSAEIRTNPDAYSAFLFHPETMEPMGVREFCEAFVEGIGREADHVQMQALSSVLRLNVKVAYLDGRGAGDEVDFVNFENGAGKDASGIRDLVLLYRPGHYDILEHRASQAERESIFAPSIYS